MNKYIGTKTVIPTPMTRAEYNIYRGWDLPANENGADEGYLVEYTDGGVPNDERHYGYISWSPKQQFDNAYKPVVEKKVQTTVTLQGIYDKITSTTYTLLPNGRTTICQLTMANGFTIEGSSACVDASNYNQHLGEKYAYEDALNNVWKFEGYLLAEKLHG